MEKAANDALVSAADMFSRINERFRIMGYGGTETLTISRHTKDFSLEFSSGILQKHGKAAACGVAHTLGPDLPGWGGPTKKA